MSGLVINGEQLEVPGLDIKNWNDDPDLGLASGHFASRKTQWIRQIVVHTTRGIPGGNIQKNQYVIPGGKNLKKDHTIPDMWNNDSRVASAHLIVDGDGSISCIADLKSHATWHAGQRDVNETSIGIEMAQLGDGGIYEATLVATVKLVEALCEHFSIQRQLHLPYRRGPVERLSQGGGNCVGVFGHRDISSNRGFGDPGDIILERLLDNGFERFNFESNEDLEAWRNRQEELGISSDGIAGPGTINALKDAGYAHGIFNQREDVSGTVGGSSGGQDQQESSKEPEKFQAFLKDLQNLVNKYLK